MKIRKLRLQNIKSYVDQEIAFHEGVNFISGINGAGKSTLIEAIGYAMFDYNPYQNIKELIRYGHKSGIITVEFCANDEREYRIVRKLGTSSLWAIYDLETESELDLHGSKDVKFWLKDAFGIDKDMDLENLFRDIIGVPQGTFVGPFLESPAIRKKKFDAILKVEQYRTAYDKTSQSVRAIKDSLIEKDKIIYGLNLEVKDYDLIKEKIGLLQKEVIESQGRLKSLGDLYKEKAAVKRTLDEIKEAINKADSVQKQQEAILGGLLDKEKFVVHNLQKAQEAQKIITDNLSGYQTFLELTETITALEGEKKQKDQLEKEYQDLVKESKVLTVLIADNEKRIDQQKEKYAKEIKEKDIEKQANLEKIQPAQAALKEVQTKQGEVKVWLEKEGQLQDSLKQLEQIFAEFKTKKQYLDGKLAKDVADSEKILTDLPRVKLEAEKLQEKDEAYKAAHSEHDVLKERLKSLEENLQQTAGGLCPFLNSSCQNIDGSLDSFFQDKIQQTKEEIVKVIQTGKELAQELDKAKIARENFLGLMKVEERLKDLKKEKEQVIKEMGGIIKRGIALPLSSILQEFSAFAQFDEKVLVKVIEAWEGFRNWVDSRDEIHDSIEEKLQEIIQEVEDFLDIAKTQRQVSEANVASELQQRSDEVTRLKTQYNELDNSINKIKKDIDELIIQEQNIVQKRNRLAALSQEVSVVQTKLMPFAKVEEKLEANKTMRQDYQEPYEKYMQKKDEADKVSALQEQKNQLDLDIKNSHLKLEENQNLQKELRTKFKQDIYDEIQKELDDIKDKGGKEKQHLLERQEDLKEGLEQIKVMEEKIKLKDNFEKSIQKEKNTLTLLEKVRSILNGAGTPIAKVYLENLSREADELYRQVSQENVKLEWRQDYEIALVDNLKGEQRLRTFKQFSGGEQMTAALAVRLALLKQQSRVRVGFFDEPTANLDSDRRMNLADTIPRITRGFDQIFIISHDDTFDSMTDNVIQLSKDAGSGTNIIN